LNPRCNYETQRTVFNVSESEISIRSSLSAARWQLELIMYL